MPSMHASTGRLFRALAAFEPAPGVLYEVPLRPDEVIELLENDAPDGWLFVRVPRGLEGLVPPLVPVKERAVAAKPAIFGRSGDRFA